MPQIADVIDWVVVGLSGLVFLACSAGAVYVFSYGGSPSRHAGASFNYLWRSRLCFQLAGAFYALVQLLRLQVFWGPESRFGDEAAHPTVVCRVYVAVEYGLLEPVLLLLALFSCIYAMQSKLAPPVTAGGSWMMNPMNSPSSSSSGSAGGSSRVGTTRSRIRHPNFNIVFFSLGFTLPCSTAQLICALFTRIFDLDYSGVTLFRLMFATYDTRQVDHCPAGIPQSSCAWCVFPILSTLISGGFLIAFLLALWVVTSRVAAAAISKLLVRRVRTLQIVSTVTLLGSLACRGVTVLFDPFELGFELLRLAHVILFSIAVLAMSYLLVWRPVRDAQLVDAHIKQLTLPMEEVVIDPGIPGSLRESSQTEVVSPSHPVAVVGDSISIVTGDVPLGPRISAGSAFNVTGVPAAIAEDYPVHQGVPQGKSVDDSQSMAAGSRRQSASGGGITVGRGRATSSTGGAYDGVPRGNQRHTTPHRQRASADGGIAMRVTQTRSELERQPLVSDIR